MQLCPLMRILIKKATLLLPNHELNGKVRDIQIENGVLTKIASNIEAGKHFTLINKKGTCVSLGLVACHTHFNDPGTEYKEDISSGLAAAEQGGFTHAFVLPNTNPPIDNKSQISYLLNKSVHHICQMHPIGAASQGLQGKQLAEIYDMQRAGAQTFGDGDTPIQNAALLGKALLYIKAFNGVLIQSAQEQSFAKQGLMNEGALSTQLGMPGIPAIAEQMQVQRDLSLLAYTDSRLHISGISTAASIALVKDAKRKGLKISCGVAWHNLLFTENELLQYNSLYKVSPPLRSEADVKALWAAVKDGTIDIIETYHMPQDWDAKHIEFEYAQAGMSTLETILTGLLTKAKAEDIIPALSTNARNIFKIESAPFAVNEAIDITIFSTEENTNYNEVKKSKSSNNPFAATSLKGSILGIVRNGKTKLFI
jgi:dihydroorotase